VTTVMIVGASGMLGHRLLRGLAAEGFDVVGTVRGRASEMGLEAHAAGARIVEGIDAEHFDTVAGAVRAIRPDVVVNAVGVIKQVAGGKAAVPAITLNALFPHRLAEVSGEIGARFITFGTDCVFSGRQGPYKETDTPDATDIYGRSKLLGEVVGAGCLTIRTSIVGRELRGGYSLFDWFISQRGKAVKGFRGALYTGVTTGTAADIVARIVREQPDLSGLWQVAGPAISKFDLLGLVRDAMGLDIVLEPDDVFHCDRRLDGSRFAETTGIRTPSWPDMVAAMTAESSLYDRPVAR
jgi:dTDP-4-dehydrorhamnose reductase